MNFPILARHSRVHHRVRRLQMLAVTAVVLACGASSARAQYTNLYGNAGTDGGGTQTQQHPDDPNATLSGLMSQDAVGNEASGNGMLSAWDGKFRVSAHACSGGGPGSGGTANGQATCYVYQDYQVVSSTLPAGTPVMIRINWAVSGKETGAGTVTHYFYGAVGGVSGQIVITVNGVSILNVSGERRRHITSEGFSHYTTGTLNVEEDSLTHFVPVPVGQVVRIFMTGTAAGSSTAGASSVVDGDSQLAMLWGIASLDPNASVISLTNVGHTPPPPQNATLPNAVDYRAPRPVGLLECFTFSEQPVEAIACASGDAGFAVDVSGTGPFTYQWYKNGVALNGLANPSATTASLMLPDVTAGDAGSYTVKITNPCGDRTSDAAMLTVTPPPTISTHPASTSVSPPTMAQVSVVANGPVDDYQWQIETAPGVWADLSSKSLALPCGGAALTDT
ncbi:MAG TPA: hypothetical protein VF720_13420, partial [Candidatus Eisenbacteria bacterium]